MQLPDPGLLLGAISAPVVTGMVTFLLPRTQNLLRVVVAGCGPIASIFFLIFHLHQSDVLSNEIGTSVIKWVPSLHLNFSFLTDGLAVFFAFLISGVGVLIILYARAYFGENETSLFRFYPALGFFTSSMLGIVLADHLLLTALFWEMTSISSFLLIGWERENETAAKRAMQAFFTTGLGGLALLGGFLLLGSSTGFWRWSELIGAASTIGSGKAVIAGFLLIFIGAASKSAQWPFHYWLPGAMLAPTPVSAFLHSATMVKAGVFLLGRILPIFSLLTVWSPIVVTFGSITMVLGATLAFRQDELKRIFAYLTVSQLGLFVCMYGLGGIEDGYGGSAIDWDLSQIASHAFYKAPLFLLAGAFAHRFGIRKLSELSNFWNRRLPGSRVLIVSLLLAGYALAGAPGTANFVVKEFFFGAIYNSAKLHSLIIGVALMAVFTAVCNVAIAVRFVSTLFGWNLDTKNLQEERVSSSDHHSDRWRAFLWLPAIGLLLLQYAGGLAPPLWNRVFRKLEVNINDKYFSDGLPWFWEPFSHLNGPLLMSLIAIVFGVGLGISQKRHNSLTDIHDRIFPTAYQLIIDYGRRVFCSFQTGHIRHYLIIIFTLLMLCVSWAAWVNPSILKVPDEVAPFESLTGLLLGAVVCASTIALPMVTERVVRVLVLGASGFSVVGLYLIYQAIDLALTQLMFEIISVLLFLLVLRLLPRLDKRPLVRRAPRLAFALLVGVTIGWLTLLAGHSADRRAEDVVTLGSFFEENSLHGTEITDDRGGEGRNIVNVILVDFRGFDTLGEITVLATAAFGVWAILPGRRRHLDKKVDSDTSDGEKTSAD